MIGENSRRERVPRYERDRGVDSAEQAPRRSSAEDGGRREHGDRIEDVAFHLLHGRRQRVGPKSGECDPPDQCEQRADGDELEPAQRHGVAK